jgi:Tol biopolymer transport system component
VFVSNISGRNNLWTIPAGGGWPTQLTISDQRQDSPAWSPDGKWIAYMSDKNGNELWDIFLVSPQSGEVTNLSATPDSAEEAPAWSPDSKQVAYMTKAKTSPSFEIEIIDIATRMPTRITKNTPPQLGNMSPLWSPDGQAIAYTQESASGKDSNVFLYDLAAGTATNLTPHSGDQTFSAEAFSPDGKSLLLTAMTTWRCWILQAKSCDGSLPTNGRSGATAFRRTGRAWCGRPTWMGARRCTRGRSPVGKFSGCRSPRA